MLHIHARANGERSVLYMNIILMTIQNTLHHRQKKINLKIALGVIGQLEYLPVTTELDETDSICPRTYPLQFEVLSLQ